MSYLFQNKIFTAETPRAQRRNFLFGGSKIPGTGGDTAKQKPVLLRTMIIFSIAGRSERSSFVSIGPPAEASTQEGMKFLIRSPSPACVAEATSAWRRPDRIRKKISLSELRDSAVSFIFKETCYSLENSNAPFSTCWAVGYPFVSVLFTHSFHSGSLALTHLWISSGGGVYLVI